MLQVMVTAITRGNLLSLLHEAADAGHLIVVLTPDLAGNLLPKEVPLQDAIRLTKFISFTVAKRPDAVVLTPVEGTRGDRRRIRGGDLGKGDNVA